MTLRGTIITTALPSNREIDDRWGVARVLTDLANVDLQAADYPRADSWLKNALQALRELGHQRGVARQLESVAWCATCQRLDEQAVALASAAAAIRQRIAAPPNRPSVSESSAPSHRPAAESARRRTRAHGATATARRWII